MNTETFSYCCDLSDFDFDFEIKERNQEEVDFLKKRVVLDESEMEKEPTRPKAISRASFPQQLGCMKEFEEDSNIIVLRKKLF